MTIGDPNTAIKRIHAALREKRDATAIEKAGRLALSQIGGCERDLWAGINGVPEDAPIPGRILVLFELGNAVEEHVVSLLRRAGYEIRDVDNDGQQFRVTVGDGASGRLDGKIRDGEGPWGLLEIKSAATKPFDRLEKLGYEAWNPKYAAQIQVYMGLAGLDHAVVVVECKNDSRLYVESICFDPLECGLLMDKALRITEADGDTVPDRPEKATSEKSSFCRYCPRNRWCWDG